MNGRCLFCFNCIFGYIEVNKCEEKFKCPACGIDSKVATGLMESPWIDCKINDLKVKCPISMETILKDGNKENQQMLLNETDEGEAKKENDEQHALGSGNKRKNNFLDGNKNKRRKIETKTCSWEGTYGQFKHHQRICQYKMNECEYCMEFGFFAKIRQSEMEEHYKSCRFYPIQCPDCNDTIQRRNLQAHLHAICIKGIITCDDCGEEIVREDEVDHDVECPNKIIPCKWFNYGCVNTFQRHRVDAHERGAAIAHLNMVKEKLDQMQAQNVFIIDHIKELQKSLPLQLRMSTPSDTISE